MNRLAVIFAFAIVALCGSAPAQDRESPDEDGDDRSRWHERGYRSRWDDRRWEQAAAFLQENSPHRWAAYEALPDEQKGRVRSAILRRHRRIERIREHSPDDVHEMVVRRVRLEDQAWHLGQQIRQAADESERRQLHKQLEQVVQTMVNEQFQEREHRIERLKRAVAREEQRLAEDRRQADQLVQKQLERIIATDHPMVDPNAPPASRDRSGGMGDDRRESHPDRDRHERRDPPGPPR